MLKLRSRAFKNMNINKIKNFQILLKFIVIRILPSAAWSVSCWIMPLKPNPYQNITSCIMSTVTRSSVLQVLITRTMARWCVLGHSQLEYDFCKWYLATRNENKKARCWRDPYNGFSVRGWSFRMISPNIQYNTIQVYILYIIIQTCQIIQ